MSWLPNQVHVVLLSHWPVLPDWIIIDTYINVILMPVVPPSGKGNHYWPPGGATSADMMIRYLGT